MGKLFEVEKGVELTREQKLMLKAFRKEWPCATNERRQEMLEEFAEMVRGAKVEEIWKSQGSGIAASASEEAAAAAAAIRAAEEKEGEIDPLKGRPHAPYLGGGDLMIIIEADNGVWSDYATFLTKNPGKTIFDVRPGKVAVAYMDQKAYAAVVAAGKALDEKEVNKCIRKIPEQFTPFEISCIEVELCLEVDYNERIKKLYKGENMEEYRSSGLFKDYFTGKIFEILHGKKEQTQQSENSGKGKGSGNNQKAKQGNGQKSNQSSGNNQSKGNDSFKVKRVGSGQPSQGKTSHKTGGNKPSGSKGSVRSGTHDQATAALFL